MCDCQSTYLKKTYYQVNFLVWSRAIWAKCMTFDSPFSKELYYQVNFLGLKQGNWAKCVTFDSPISQEPYIIKSVSWVWLSIHLFLKNFIIKSISWVEPGQLDKMYDFRFTYFKRTIYFRVMFNTMYFHAPQLFITNVQIRRENYNIKSISWVEAGQ